MVIDIVRITTESRNKKEKEKKEKKMSTGAFVGGVGEI